MRNSQYFQSRSTVGNRLSQLGANVPKKFLVGAVLLVAVFVAWILQYFVGLALEAFGRRRNGS